MSSTPVVVLDSTLTNIADAIRDKNGSQDTYKPGEMAAAITAIPSGGGGGIPREISAQGVFQMPAQSFTFSLPASATDIGSHALGSAFYFCSSLASVDLSSLTTVSGGSAFSNAFRKCTSLTSLSFPALTASSFGANTNQFNNMLQGCSNVTVHFPASIQSTIGSWSSVTNGFGGTNTTVLFDL